MPNNYYFNITYDCNSRCQFCASALTKFDSPKRKNISLQQFRFILDSLGLSARDRITINGGEPTVHKDFFGFLSAVKEKRAQLTLFTNARLIANHDFADRLSAFTPLELLISVYSMEASIHDNFTDIPGSLHQTLQGVDNLFKLQANGYDLFIEFRLLISRFTAPHTLDIVRRLAEMYKSRSFTFSINPLIVSQKALKGNHAVPLTELRPLIAQLEEEIRASGRYPILRNIPKCILWQISPQLAIKDRVHRTSTISGTYFDPYTEPEQTSNINEHTFASACNLCILRQSCAGFPVGHLETLGENDVRPVTEENYLDNAPEVLLGMLKNRKPS